MAWLHTWSGLLVGWVLYFVFLTGTAGYFDAEIDRWMRPELPLRSAPMEQSDAVRAGLSRLHEVAPRAERWNVNLPDRNSDPTLRVSWRTLPAQDGTPGISGAETLFAPEEETTAPRRTGGGQLLYQMHYRLHYVKAQDAYWIVGFCSMFMLVAILTGVITHKKIFKDFFTFRPAKGQRSWLDLHNVLSVAALPFHLMITYSGLVLFMFTYMPAVMDEVYGNDEKQGAFFDAAYPELPEMRASGRPAPLVATDRLLMQTVAAAPGPWYSLNVFHPGDAAARIVLVRQRDTPQSGAQQLVFDGVSGALLDAEGIDRFGPRKVNDALIGLHEGLFAGPLLRWGYFLSGLLGTAMIATGLVLWTVKRRNNGSGSFGLALVERLNVGTIAGLPIGIAAYFLANRLLPIGFEWRGMWEAHVMFGMWAFVFAYSLVRPVRKAWLELLTLCASLFLLIPMVNALTTDRHLGVTLPYDGWHGDWALAGFDLTMLGIGGTFAAGARYLWKRARLSDVAFEALRPVAPLGKEVYE